MNLLRAWVRQLAGASLTAICIPLALVSALAVLTFTGGFGSLGALGQAFGGPASLPAQPTLAPKPATAVLATLAARPAHGPAATAAARPSGPPPVSRFTPSGASAPASGPMAAVPTPVGGPGALSAAPAPAARPATTPSPAAHPTVVDESSGVLATLTGSLPAPAGAAASQAVHSAAAAVPPGPGLVSRASLP